MESRYVTPHTHTSNTTCSMRVTRSYPVCVCMYDMRVCATRVPVGMCAGRLSTIPSANVSVASGNRVESLRNRCQEVTARTTYPGLLNGYLDLLSRAYLVIPGCI